jgi:hypothetical protein
MQREPIVAFPWQHILSVILLTVIHSSALHTMHCCISIATVVTGTLIMLHCLSCSLLLEVCFLLKVEVNSLHSLKFCPIRVLFFILVIYPHFFYGASTCIFSFV